MKIELKEFQTISAKDILGELDEARVSAAKGKPQAVVLSAPTGTGKTVTLAAVIEWTLAGDNDGITARPDTTFLWLSDSPELNSQSLNKLMMACDNVPFYKLHTVDSESFDAERLEPGYVYFINTQLLGRDKLLSKTGDKRAFTFWQTVANTITDAPQDFILIIDEAHRGAGITDKARKPIMQKFITGSDDDGIPPVPLVLGMSATPQRFTELLGTAARTQRPIIVDPKLIRESGLIKDLIIVNCAKRLGETDLTLLESAAARWKYFCDRWSDYCTREKETDMVRPILVVQVEDGTEGVITRSPLNDIITVIERQLGTLKDDEIVHCFQDKDVIQFGGHSIRKMDASRIQDAQSVKVVLFKTALTTGWDCPRAEVMMSFRKAQDATSIAQLVGRMIRTPLARRIESDELLNTVELFLPHYNKESLDSVLEKLRNPEAHDGVSPNITTKAVDYPRNRAFNDVFPHLATLQTYFVHRAVKMSNVKRSLRLAGMLVAEGIDSDADNTLRNCLTDKLKELGDSYAKQDPNWENVISEGGEIDMDVMAVSLGSMSITETKATRMTLSLENINRQFDHAGRLLAPGEGLHWTYWKRFSDDKNSQKVKLEFHAIIKQAGTLSVMEKLSDQYFDNLWDLHKKSISKLPAALKAKFLQLAQTSGKPVAQDWELPDYIVVTPGDNSWDSHMFSNQEGIFSTKLNTWETEFLKTAMAQDGFVCWLRNPSRGDGAFCIPYEHNGEKPFYPDFLIIRKRGGSFEVDILEPHDDTRTDTFAKVKGLAEFADRHGSSFGRLMFGRKKDGKRQIIDVSDRTTRAKAIKIGAAADLEALWVDDSA